MVGPVVVDDAEPGDVIECKLETLRTRDWGWNSFPLGVGALPSYFKGPYVHYFRFDDAGRAPERVSKGSSWELALPRGVRLTADGRGATDLPPTTLQSFIEEIEAGRVKVPIGHVFRLEEIVKAHQPMEDGTMSGKLVVTTGP